jgi:hypothetical protein
VPSIRKKNARQRWQLSATRYSSSASSISDGRQIFARYADGTDRRSDRHPRGPPVCSVCPGATPLVNTYASTGKCPDRSSTWDRTVRGCGCVQRSRTGSSNVSQWGVDDRESPAILQPQRRRQILERPAPLRGPDGLGGWRAARRYMEAEAFVAACVVAGVNGQGYHSGKAE